MSEAHAVGASFLTSRHTGSPNPENAPAGPGVFFRTTGPSKNFFSERKSTDTENN
jgi:hypothetical protein